MAGHKCYQVCSVCRFSSVAHQQKGERPNIIRIFSTFVDCVGSKKVLCAVKFIDICQDGDFIGIYSAVLLQEGYLLSDHDSVPGNMPSYFLEGET